MSTTGPEYTSRPSANLRALTGLRFFAALAVVLLHATHTFLPRESISYVFGAGGVGVSFFFILSGFVLSWSQSEQVSNSNFYRNRFARIFPLHLLTWLLAGALILLSGEWISVPVAATTLLLLQAWVPVQSFYFGMNGPSWSLSDESFFYAMFPFLNRRGRRLDRRGLFRVVLLVYVFVGAITIVLHWALRDGPSVGILYVNPLYRVWEFVIGILLSRLIRSGWKPRFSLNAITATTMVVFLALGALNYLILEKVGSFSRLPMGALPSDISSLALVPLFFLLIGAAATHELEGKRTVLAHPSIVRLGKWSFALYLSHLLLITGVQLVVPANAPIQLRYFVSAGVVLVAVAISGVLYRSVEMPLERWLRSPRAVPRVD